MWERRILRSRLFGACGLIAALALLVPLWVVAAPASSGTVQQVAIGAYVNFVGSGFEAGETIALQATGPDGAATPLSSTEATGTGTFTVSVSFPSAGMWQVTAHGNTSGNEFMGRFSVGTSSPTAAPAPPNTTPEATTGGIPATATAATASASSSSASTSSTVPQGLPPGTAVTTIGAASAYTANGFNAGEEISRWSSAPDGAVATLGNTFADATGAFSDNATFATNGLWQITAHGKESAHEVISRFYVTGESTATTPGSTPGAVGPSTSSTIVKVSASQRVPFAVSGYTAYETVSVWMTSPEGSVTALDPVQANGSGRVTIATTFPSAGLWQITAHGQASGKEVVGRYQVTL